MDNKTQEPVKLSKHISDKFCGPKDEGYLSRNSVAVLAALAAEDKEYELTPNIWKYVCGFILHPDIDEVKDLPEFPEHVQTGKEVEFEVRYQVGGLCRFLSLFKPKCDSETEKR